MLDFVILDDAMGELHPKKYSKKEIELYENRVINDIMKLVDNKVFMNSLVSLRYSHTLIVGEMEEALDKAKELLILIDKELK